jgi:hypothetical protein
MLEEIVRAFVRSGPQGSESGLTGECTEEGCQRAGVPTGDLSPVLEGSLIFCLSEEVDGEVSDDWRPALGQARCVVVEDNIEHTVKPILDPPIPAHSVGGLSGR